MHADRIRIRIVGTSKETLSGITGRREGRLLRILRGPSVTPLMTYLGQLDYIRLFLGTLKLNWALWWIRRSGESSPKKEL
jgi:hypothetical protein